MAWNDDDMREMLGKVMVSVKQNGEELIFTDGDGIKYIFYHSQSCCESVDIDDIKGELDWLVGLPMLMVEEVHNDASPKTSEYGYEPESYTWTFYSKLIIDEAYTKMKSKITRSDIESGLTLGIVEAQHEGRPVDGSKWFWLQGLTAAARQKYNSDDKVALESKASEILLSV